MTDQASVLIVCAWMTVAFCFDTKAWDGNSPVEPVCTESQHYHAPSGQPLTGINQLTAPSGWSGKWENFWKEARQAGTD